MWQIWFTEQELPNRKSVPVKDWPSWQEPVDLRVKITALGISSEDGDIPKNSHALGGAFTNEFRPLEVAEIKPVGLGSARVEMPLLRPGIEPIFYDVDVPPGTRKLEAVIAAKNAPVDSQVTLAILHVYPTHKPAGTGAYSTILALDSGPGVNKRLEVENPPAGKYKIVLDPLLVPAAGLQLSYRDAYYHDAFGAIEVRDEPAKFEKGAEHKAEVSLSVSAEPTAGRKLVGQIGLFASGVVRTKLELPLGIQPLPEAKITREAVPIATQTFIYR